MATRSRKPNKNISSNMFFLALLLVLSVSASSSSASRLLNDDLHLPGNQQAQTFLLPTASSGKVHSGGCVVVIPVRLPAAGRKFGPMILSKLPKGDFATSGPSRGTNSKND